MTLASRDLTALMRPASVAVVGASQRVGRGTRVIANLQQFGYAGRVFPVNPRYGEVLGLPCYPDLAALPEPADLVVVAVPAAGVPDLLANAVGRGTRAAVILSSGFGEAGPAGRERQAALERLSAERGLLICGPNCYGVFNVRLGMAAFSADFLAPPRPGAVALVSQSGGFSHAIAEALSNQRAVGLSHIVSCGNQAGVGIEDYLEFLVEDPDTAVVGAYVEGFRQPGRLRAIGARARELGTTVVVLKVGQSENAREAMLTHTGSLAGAPEIAAAVLRQAGFIPVASLNEMLDALALLAAAGARRAGPRVAVLSGLGGECGRVSDAADRVGLALPPLSAATAEALRAAMPDFATPRNPLDGTGAMYENPAIFPRLIDVLLDDPDVDVLAVNLRANVPRPGGWAPSREFSRVIRDAVKARPDRLVVAFSSFAGGDLDQEVIEPLAEAGVPFLDGTETALLALRHFLAHRGVMARTDAPRSPGLDGRVAAPRPGSAALGVELLREAGIPVVPMIAARDAAAAARAADQLGYPVALKVDSPDLPHKSDVGGVRLGCADAEGVRRAFAEMLAEVRRRAPAARVDGAVVQPMIGDGVEMILGVKRDPLFGPAVVCGFGGVYVELLRDVAVRVPPIDAGAAREMLAELRGHALLRGARGRPPADVAALAETIVRVGALAASGRVRSLDLNPLLVLPEGRGVVAVDWLLEPS